MYDVNYKATQKNQTLDSVDRMKTSINNKGILYSTRNYRQYFVIHHNGKLYRECIDICITEFLCYKSEINMTL